MSELIISVLVVSGIGALLALLLELADTFIADYGDCHILINDKKDMVVKGGSPLLFSLQDEEIFIPSACGGKGTCAYCKVKVLEGGGPVLATETPYLSAEEQEDHVRLSCQVKVRNDLSIEIPEELFLIKEFRVQVKSVVNLNRYIKGIVLELLSADEGIIYKPGQYIQLEIPKYKLSSAPEFRAFSMASTPEKTDEVELYVGLVEKGIVSTYIHHYLQEGDELVMRGPFGDFYYRESDRDILMIATGTGLAPIMSILRYMRRKKIQRKTALFFGTRIEEDLFSVAELEDVAKELPNFSYVLTLSRVPDHLPWRGERGRVTSLIEQRIPEGADLDVYICGNPDMVDSSIEILKTKGIPEKQIYFDKFS